MKTYIRRQQHKNVFKHQDIKQKEPPQKYRLRNKSFIGLLGWFYRKIRFECHDILIVGKSPIK